MRRNRDQGRDKSRSAGQRQDRGREVVEEPNVRKIQTTNLIRPVTENQRRFVDSIKRNVVTIGHGEAGVGKSILSLHTAIQLFNSDQNDIDKIYYVRANVGLYDERELGYLAGSLADKILPLAYPVLDNLVEFMEEGKAKYLIEKEVIQVIPFAFIRGRSFANSIVILDESQNSSKAMIKTALTRISYGTKMVLIGDQKQSDLRSDKAAANGLTDAVSRFSNCPGVGMVRFGKQDIQRHPIIKDILDRYGE